MKIKHKIMLLAIGSLLALSLCLSASYAFYIFRSSQDELNVANSDCFRITFNDGNAININNGTPITDKQAKQLAPYTFTIKNVCNNIMDYSVNIETLNTSTIDLNAVAVKLDGKQKKILGSLENNETIINSNVSSSKTIQSGILRDGEERTHKLRIWVDIDATVEQSADKIYESKVVVTGKLKTGYKEANLMSGDDVNLIFKTLSGDTPSSTLSYNTSITSIQRSLTPPTESDNAVDISLKNDQTISDVEYKKSDVPIYAWFSDGTIYIYCETNKIFLTSGQSLFESLTNVQSIDLSFIDTSKTRSMELMFSRTYNLTNLDLRNFDTSFVTNMRTMFYNSKNLTDLDISNFDTSNVEDMSYTFSEMKNLTNLNINNIETSKVSNMNSMFAGTSQIVSLDLTDFDTSNVNDMTSMFSEMTNLTDLNLSSFDTSKVTNMSGMFYGVSRLQSLDLRNFDTSKVTNMSAMFYSMDDLTSIDLSSFNTSNVTNTENMFASSPKIEILDVSSFDTSKVTNMNGMFNAMTKLKTIYAGSNWTTANVTKGNNMFYSTQLVGGSGTTFDLNNTSYVYARIDDPTNGNPGYLTLK